LWWCCSTSIRSTSDAVKDIEENAEEEEDDEESKGE
jgi:hypothetical protein